MFFAIGRAVNRPVGNTTQLIVTEVMVSFASGASIEAR
jgi:hypothetical protein